ncbi:MAG TPA: N-acetylmuramoyl-L-alanine amidase-like domain-containing protein [Verrucomicrobiae bacterium]|nr:N-acetylmuramoyl-L-alanine amidase-like domain-containing protein [Verrucomicrobiae bacterium]
MLSPTIHPSNSTSSITQIRINRREAIRLGALGTLGFLASSAIARAAGAMEDQMKHFQGQEVFEHIVSKAQAENWKSLPIGELIGKIAMELKGTPYVGFTLEVSPNQEFCVINLKGLDCVTFFEDSLCMARMLKKGKSSPEDLISEVQYTRYRGGKMGDYTTRLHYTTDWFVDNAQKGVVKNLTPELPGAEPFTQKVGIMSEHPENYRQLKAHPEFLPVIRHYEEIINARSLKYLPMAKLKDDEHLLATGDIVGVCTTQPGIDIAHTGLCIKDEQGVVHFMDASSSRRNMKVTFEREISETLNWSRRLTGVMFARPLEVGA